MTDASKKMEIAAVEFLKDRGYVLDQALSSQHEMQAIGAVVEATDKECLADFFCESLYNVDTGDTIIQDTANAFLSINNRGQFDPELLQHLGEQFLILISYYFQSYVTDAKAKLKYDGLSDAEEWTMDDNAQRLADLRADQ